MAVNLTSHDTFLRYDKEKLIIESLEPTKNAEIGPHQVTVILTAKVNGQQVAYEYDIIIIVITEQETQASFVPGQQQQDDSVTSAALELSTDQEIDDEPIQISELNFSDQQAVKEAIAKAFGVIDVEKKLRASQSVLPVDDKTDLDAAAKFDFQHWAQTSGVTKIDAELPEQLVSIEL